MKGRGKNILWLFLVFFISKSNSQLEEANYLLSSLQPLIEDAKESFRLPEDVKPMEYRVEIIPDAVAEKRFHGKVQITLRIESATSQVLLNVEGITIESSRLIDVSVPAINLLVTAGCTQSEVLRKYQLLECNTTSALSPARIYQLDLDYLGSLAGDSRGLYLSNYKENGVEQQIYTTHFGQQARRLLPCFDETRFKATFQFNIHRQEALHNISISNANLDQTVPGPQSGWVIDQFKKTAKIPSYIVAIVISRFRGRLDGTRGQHKFGVYARPSAYDQTGFAQELGARLMDALGNWTNSSYYDFEAVEKMEIAAIPDFSAGGE